MEKQGHQRGAVSGTLGNLVRVSEGADGFCPGCEGPGREPQRAGPPEPALPVGVFSPLLLTFPVRSPAGPFPPPPWGTHLVVSSTQSSSVGRRFSLLPRNGGLLGTAGENRPGFDLVSLTACGCKPILPSKG